MKISVTCQDGLVQFYDWFLDLLALCRMKCTYFHRQFGLYFKCCSQVLPGCIPPRKHNCGRTRSEE